MNKFEELLKEYGQLVNAPLHPEKDTLCKLVINSILSLQLEYEENRDRLLIASLLADVPPGKFRENLCKEALKANNDFPKFGTFAYLEKANKLVFFEYVPFSGLTGARLFDLVNIFVEKADLWRVAIETGQLSSIAKTPTSSTPPPPFGLKR